MTIVRKTMTGAALGMSLSLAGCLELAQDIGFRDNGEARVEVEIAISTELVALASNPAFAKQPGAEGLNLFGECGKPWSAKEPLPAGVRSIESKRGKRGDLDTCTMIFDVSDPVAAVESAKQIDVPSAEVPKQKISLSRLPSSSGYRLQVEVASSTPPGLPPEAAEMMVALTKAMLANRYLTLSLSGQRIENTNGELSADKRKVTWKLPLASLVAPSPDNPTTIEADVIYR